MQNIKTQISISRVTSTKEDDYIALRIHDGLNGNQLIDMKLTLVDYAKLVSGLNFVGASGTVSVDVNKLNKIKYMRKLRVPVKTSSSIGFSEKFKDEMVEWSICSVINDFGFEYKLYDFMNSKNYKYDDGIINIFVDVTKYLTTDSIEENEYADEVFDALQVVYDNNVFEVK